MAIIKTRQKIIKCQQEREEIRTLCIGARIVKWCSCCRKWYVGFLKKLKIELPYDPAIQLLGIHPKKLKAGSSRDI